MSHLVYYNYELSKARTINITWYQLLAVGAELCEGLRNAWGSFPVLEIMSSHQGKWLLLKYTILMSFFNTGWSLHFWFSMLHMLVTDKMLRKLICQYTFIQVPFQWKISTWRTKYCLLHRKEKESRISDPWKILKVLKGSHTSERFSRVFL